MLKPAGEADCPNFQRRETSDTLGNTGRALRAAVRTGNEADEEVGDVV
jgi:hypothetical protein